MTDQASLTALMSLYARAFHTQNDRPLIFEDTLARQLMTDEEYVQMGRHLLSGRDFFSDPGAELPAGEAAVGCIVRGQLAPTPLARARFCADALANERRLGATQYVVLGAGMDTSAFGSGADGMQVFEVDHPATQAEKLRRVRRAGWTAPERVHFVPVDLSRDDLTERLLAAGLDPHARTFFTWLGVTYYLTGEEIDRTLSSLGRLAAEGSAVAFDYPAAGLLESDVLRVRRMRMMAEAGGEPMRAGRSEAEWATLLQVHGFLLYENLTDADIERRYFAGRTDGLHAFEQVSLALAVRKAV